MAFMKRNESNYSLRSKCFIIIYWALLIKDNIIIKTFKVGMTKAVRKQYVPFPSNAGSDIWYACAQGPTTAADDTCSLGT